MSAIHRLEELGQSVWLDFIDRDMVRSGELERLVREDGIRGVTSNPTIFEKAITRADTYDAFLRAAPPIEPDSSVLERLMVADLTAACDVLRPIYDASGGADGFASIEVDPTLAEETAAEIEQAARLWNAVNRPNLMVKIPGTRAGIPAILSCLAHGININITLLFSVPRYREVAEAYMRALERRVKADEPLDRIASVASFFVSRVDTKIDKALDAMPNAITGAAGALRGQIAIANARIAYEEYQRVIQSERWRSLAAKGARPQRLLWASTSPKDPRYADTCYVEALIGRDTIDTMTSATLDAYVDHGHPELRLETDLEEAHAQMTALRELSIDFVEIAEHLEDEGVASFAASYRAALAAIRRTRSGSIADANLRI